MRGHPVFVAQHATATGCRSCLTKWHGTEKGKPLDPPELDYVVGVIRQWLELHGVAMNRMGEFLIDGPTTAPVTITLAHGAGAGMDSPFMAFLPCRSAGRCRTPCRAV